MTEPRLTRLVPATMAAAMLALAGCTAPVGVTEPNATYNQASAERMFDYTYRNINSRYIDAVSVAQIASDGIAGLATLDDKFSVEQASGSLTLSYAANPVAQFQLPASNSPDQWASLTADVINAGRTVSPSLAAAGAEDIYEAVIDNALITLDSYSRYLSAAEAADDRAQRDGFGGVGIGIDDTPEDGVEILNVLPDTPGEDAGLKSGDVIVAIEGRSVYTMSQREVLNALRGQIGTRVEVSIWRGGEPPAFEVTVTRGFILQSLVDPRLEGNIGIVRVLGFNQSTAEDLQDAIGELLRQSGGNLSGVVLDLRDNPGGLLDQAVIAADLFVGRGLVGWAQGRHPDSGDEFAARAGDILNGRSLVVLMNGRSASAAEVLAAALQDTGRAIVVGSTSFGKGVVQTVLSPPNNGELILTWSALHAPSGYEFHGRGILPNVCTSGFGDDAAAVIAAFRSNIASTRQSMEAWRATPQSDAADQALRASCVPEEDTTDVDVTVAQRLITDSNLFSQAAQLTSQQFATARY